MDLFLSFCAIPLIYTSDFVLVPYCFDDCPCSVFWRQKNLIPPALFFSPQKGFGYSWSFFVSIQILRIFCSNSVKNAISNLQGLHWICRLLWIVHFGNINSSNLRTQFVFPLCHLYFISILHFLEYWPLCCFSSIAQLCLTLWSPMDCSTSGFPVPHYLPKFTQVHVHCISDAILWSSSALKFPNIRDFIQWVSCLHQVTNMQELKPQNQAFQWVFTVCFL